MTVAGDNPGSTAQGKAILLGGSPSVKQLSGTGKLFEILSRSTLKKSGKATIYDADPVRRYILIIAHDTNERDILWAGLQLSGYAEVLWPAANWKEAAQLAQYIPVALVIVDSDAASLAQGHLEFRQDTGVPIVVLGSKGIKEADASLPIPYQFQDLLSTVAQYLPDPLQLFREASASNKSGADGDTSQEARLYRDLIDRLGDIIVLLDADTHMIIDANHQAVLAYGYTREELIGMSLLQLVPREEHPSILENTLSVLCGQKVMHVRQRTHVRKDGTVLRVTVSASLLEYNGRLIFHDIVRDETERIHAEEALLEARNQLEIRVEERTVALRFEVEARRESEKRFRATFEQAAVGMAHVALDGQWLRVNQKLCEIVGYTDEALLASRFQDITHPEDIDRDLVFLHQLLKDEIPNYSMEKRYLKKNGEIVWIHLTVSLVKKKSGEPDYFISVIEDIVERKKAEAELCIAATAFESQDGIFITDIQRRILRVNRAFTKITGYSAKKAIGQPDSMLQTDRHNALFYSEMWQIVHRAGVWQGEVWSRRKNGEVYPAWLTISAVKGVAGAVTHYVNMVTDITKRKAAEEEIQYLAFYDPLTRLPNRRLLLDHLKQALTVSGRSGYMGALLFIDLDNFKTINDTLGHGKGDLLLQQVAQRLQRCTREGDMVVRVGGDEFAVVLENLSENTHDAAVLAKKVGEKIISALNDAYNLDSYVRHCTPSIGVTLFFAGDTIDELQKRADLAMYQAKAAGRNTIRFFDPQMQAVVTARAEMEADLRRGLDEGQLLLYYQPQVNSAGQLIGAEGLVRWQHPKRGLVPPAEFIPLAEDTMLILPLGEWVMEMACKQLVVWSTQPDMSSLTLAVNVSAYQFRQPDFLERVFALVNRTGANPERLKLELTESLFMEDVDNVIAKMTAMKAFGIQFSLDDFGTGYSSLSYLKRMPLNQVKIDQSFVRDMLSDTNAAVITQAIITLAHSLGLSVIAEGVETEAQRDFLAHYECHSYQGYLFGRPGPVEALYSMC